MRPRDVLSPTHELDLFLVSEGLKRACFVTLDGRYLSARSYGYVHATGQENMAETCYEIFPWVISGFQQYLLGKGLVFEGNARVESIESSYPGDWEQHKDIIHFLDFHIARTVEHRDALVNAKTEQDIGLALGYPPSAVNNFNRLVGGELRGGNYLLAKIGLAVHEGVPLPMWLPYISFVPSQLDIVWGDISSEARDIGVRYRDYVLEHNPALAQRVESGFLNQRWPERIELQPDGAYILTFNHTKAVPEMPGLK